MSPLVSESLKSRTTYRRCGDATDVGTLPREKTHFSDEPQESREERAGRKRERERWGEKGAICIGQENCGARSERKGGEWGGGGETETRTASTDRRSVPIATRRDRARNRHVLHARFSTCMCPCINVHTRQIHFRAARSKARSFFTRLPREVPEGSKVANCVCVYMGNDNRFNPLKTTRPPSTPAISSVLGETGGTPARFISLRVHMA